MLSDNNANAVLAVKDINVAKEFYEDKLGLKSSGTDPDGTYYQSGNSQILVYQSDYAGTNKATSAGWRVDNLEEVVEELKSKGVTFEHYDFPGGKREGDIHILGEGDSQVKAVWFKDPDGNILAIDQH